MPPPTEAVQVEEPPVVMLEGEAEHDPEIAGTTLTVAAEVAEPPAPVQVRVYVVVDPGETATVPDGGATAPTPLMLAEVEFVQEYVSAELLPATIEVGFAESEAVGTALPACVAVAQVAS